MLACDLSCSSFNCFLALTDGSVVFHQDGVLDVSLVGPDVDVALELNVICLPVFSFFYSPDSLPKSGTPC